MILPEKITRKQVIKILENHGFKTSENTTFDTIKREYVKNTSFDDEMGINEFYSTKKVFNWLGY